MNSSELCKRWNLDQAGLRRLIGNRSSISLEEVSMIEGRWHEQLQASRQAWNQRIAERKAQTA